MSEKRYFSVMHHYDDGTHMIVYDDGTLRTGDASLIEDAICVSWNRLRTIASERYFSDAQQGGAS